MCKELDPERSFDTADGWEPSYERTSCNSFNNQVNDDKKLEHGYDAPLSQKNCLKQLTSGCFVNSALAIQPLNPEGPTSVWLPLAAVTTWRRLLPKRQD